MKISKALFAIGLVLLVPGMVIVIVPETVETRRQRREALVDRIVTVSGGAYSSILPDSGSARALREDARNILVTGTVIEIRGVGFDFYAFDKGNYELWIAKASYRAYVEAKDVSSYSFSFSPTREEATNVLHFVVVNRNPITGPNISAECSIELSWTERSYGAVLSELIRARSLGILLGGLGLLIVVSAVMVLVFKGQRKEETTEPVGSIASTPSISASKTQYCRECGTALTPIGATGRSYCSKCNKICD